MQRHFVQELEALKKDIIKMGSLAEQAIAESIRAVLRREPETAKQVLVRESAINEYELKNDYAVVDLLALQQPVASDLRFILAALKINNDLERIGDHAVNIAESAISYSKKDPLPLKTDFQQMAQIAETMLREAIDGFIHSDPRICRGVLAKDDLIDELNKKTVMDLVSVIRSKPEFVEQALDLVRVSRNLERVGDLATNIAEEVIFMAEAHVVKHHFETRGNRQNE